MAKEKTRTMTLALVQEEAEKSTETLWKVLTGLGKFNLLFLRQVLRLREDRDL